MSAAEYDLAIYTLHVSRTQGYASAACGALLVRELAKKKLLRDAERRPRLTIS